MYGAIWGDARFTILCWLELMRPSNPNNFGTHLEPIATSRHQIPL